MHQPTPHTSPRGDAGAAATLASAGSDWSGAGCGDTCTGACALATHGICVADPSSAQGGRCADRDVASDPP
jgi:hypothetical protein